jgi:hypothetical protein
MGFDVWYFLRKGSTNPEIYEKNDNFSFNVGSSKPLLTLFLDLTPDGNFLALLM